MKLQESGQEAAQLPEIDGNRHAEILGQLAHIQDSPAFCNSTRSKEFLFYVVEQALSGHNENLKERSIGVNLFHRAPTYDTGEDPIVRVKAGEVRRRLAEYYAAETPAPPLHIELPVGSYVPKFRWINQSPPSTLEPEVVVAEQLPAPPIKRVGWKAWSWKTWGSVAALAIVGLAATYLFRAYFHRPSTLDQFWEPLNATKQPVLICVPSPVAYAMSSDVYPKPPAPHSQLYDSVARRNITPLQLDPEATIKWKQITPLADFYVNKDDAYAAEELSAYFSATHRPTQIRLGSDYTYEDIQRSPAILIGAYNNPWMNRVMSELPIGFHESGGILWIEDWTKPGQVWKSSLEGRLGNKDFALVARVLDSKTGQFLLIASGIGMVGTKAAGEFITHDEDLKAALNGAPAGWSKKNLEIVIETDIVDTSPSPPRAVAVKVW